MEADSSSAAFTRIAMAAAPHFLERGYAGVSLRALAEELGLKPASLYYHCPGGKAQLYAQSLIVFLGQYQQELAAAPGRAGFPKNVFRMAEWMLEHPPVDLQQTLRVDLPHLAPEDAKALVSALHDAVIRPLALAFDRAREEGKVRRKLDSGVAASAVVALVDGLGFSHLPAGGTASEAELQAARQMVQQGLNLLLDGARIRD